MGNLNQKTCIIIPARYNSSRLQGKVLSDLSGKSVIQRVFEQVSKVKNVDKIIIATDSGTVYDHCLKFTPNVVITDKHESGTDRIAEVALKSEKYDNIINVQGDEPFICPNLISELIDNLISSDNNIITVKKQIKDIKDLKNPNVVKVINNNLDKAIYFSRSILPLDRDNIDSILNDTYCLSKSDVNYYKHIGIYGYKRDFLIKYSQMKQTILENTEKLEQLRILENGFDIKLIETNTESIGIDTQEDLDKARELFNN